MADTAQLTIIFDAVTKSVIVNCRDRIKMLIGPYENRSKAVAAAEKFARDMGWI